MATFDRCRSTTPPANPKQWLPGNYMASTTTNTASIWNKVGSGPGTEGMIQRMDADTQGDWQGALLRFNWTHLEGDTLGDYSLMNNIKAYLDQMDRYNGTKRLIIFIELKSFNPDAAGYVVPKYMRDSTTYIKAGEDFYTTVNGVRKQGSLNGQYAYESSNGGPGGYVVNMHVTTVRDRFKALMQEFATRFNGHRNLEAIVFGEASIAEPAGAVGKATETKANGDVITRPNTQGEFALWSDTNLWLDNLTNAYQDMKTNFTNIQICQWINAERSNMDRWVPLIRAAGIGLGMPDLCPEEKGFNYRNDIPNFTGDNDDPPGNIQHCQDSNGLAIIMGHASKPALEGTVVGRCQTSSTIQQQPHVYPAYPGVGTHRQAIRDFAVNTVGVTHLCWAHNTGNQPVTGAVDDQIPANCAKNPYTAFGNYGGRKYNVVTDEYIHASTSTITTVSTRPNGW